MSITDTLQGTGQTLKPEQAFHAMKAKMLEEKISGSDLITDPNKQYGVVDDPAVADDDAVDPVDAAENGDELEEAPAEAEPEAEEPDPRLIILPDGSEVTIEEARKGYLRQSDFSKKTEIIAREREAIAARENVIMGELRTLIENVEGYQEKEPDWVKLSQEKSAEEYNQWTAHWANRTKTLQRAKAEISRNNQIQLREAKRVALDTLSSGEYNPAWKDPKVLTEALDKVSRYLQEERGYSHSSLQQMTDPIAIQIADESRLWRELQARKPTVLREVTGKPKITKPGARTAVSAGSEQITAFQDAFRKNPSVNNAVALQKARDEVNRRK